MSGSGSEKRSQALAKRIYQLRLDGVSVKQTAELAGVHKGRVRTLQVLGERLMQVNP
ncbi:hypothetical protein Pfra02_04350 [Pseudomonas fragi]|nr:hypothetical protein Pfra02_04350 [Pseudomonas fragi]